MAAKNGFGFTFCVCIWPSRNGNVMEIWNDYISNIIHMQSFYHLLGLPLWVCYQWLFASWFQTCGKSSTLEVGWWSTRAFTSIFFRGVETTNQHIYIYTVLYIIYIIYICEYEFWNICLTLLNPPDPPAIKHGKVHGNGKVIDSCGNL